LSKLQIHTLESAPAGSKSLLTSVEKAEISAFLAAGYTMEQVLEVILAVAHKTISNYANHIADTPLDDAFGSRAWTPRSNRD